MKVAEDSVVHVRLVYDKVKAQVDSAPRDDGTLLEKRKELQREVDVTKRTLTQQVPETQVPRSQSLFPNVFFSAASNFNFSTMVLILMAKILILIFFGEKH